MGVLTGLNSWWLPCQWARCYQNAALCITGRAILSCRINGSLTFIGGSFVAPTHASTKVIHPKYYKLLAYILAHGHTNWGFVCSKPRVYSIPGIYNFGTGMGWGYKTTYYHLGYISLASTQREESSGASLVIWPSVFVEGACVTAWIVYCWLAPLIAPKREFPSQLWPWKKTQSRTEKKVGLWGACDSQ